MSAPPSLDAHTLIERLNALCGERPSAIAFDADGTLWTGDVGEDVFGETLHGGHLRDDAEPALAALADAYRLERANGEGANAIARRLLHAHGAGILPNLAAYEMMTWAFAGFTPDELGCAALRILRARGVASRLQAEVLPVLTWAREHGVRIAIISASAHAVIGAALEATGLEVDHVVAGEAALVNGRFLARMERPLPFGPTKRTAGIELFRGLDWVAAFGDSEFDLEMLSAARLGVLVRPKDALLRLAPGNGSLVTLARDGEML